MNSITLKTIETKTCLWARGVTCTKTTKNTKYSTQNENKESLITNSNHEIRRTKTKT
jgi:NADH dehydrogenase FAD-containing subunit